MHQNNCTPQNTDCKSHTEFDSILKSLESESSTLFNLTNELLRKADSLLRFTPEPCKPEQESVEPTDIISKISYELNVIKKQNDKLNYLLLHLNKII